MRKSLLAGVGLSLALSACNAPSAETESAGSTLTDTNRARITEYARLRQVGATHEEMEQFNSAARIEHNPEIPDGIEGDRTFLEARREAAPDKYDPLDKYVNVTHSILADGEFVAVKSHLFVSPSDRGRIFFDIWRLKDGQIAEHWDVIEPVGPEADALAVMSCGVGITYEAAKAVGNTAENPSCGKADLSVDSEASRKLVLAYLEASMDPAKLTDAVQTYLAPDFALHRPNVPAGHQGLLDYLKARTAQRKEENRRHHVQRVLADGDLVLVHRWVTSDTDPRGVAYADLFRVKNGKIIDHWDLAQPVPPFSVAGRSMTGGADTPLEPNRVKGPAQH